MSRSPIAGLGEVMQIAFVPADFDAALHFWTEVMGAGPFFLLEGTRTDSAHHRGAPTDPELTIALGHWGDMQIEIIRQDNDAPSPYREWRDAGGEGVHHVCVVVDDLDRAADICRGAGAEPVFTGEVAGTRWFYAETGGGPGTILEVVCHGPLSGGLMTMIRDAARGWDGSDPVRRLPPG